MKNYNTKKKITIAVLAVVAVFLAGGLWVYMDSMNNKEPAALAGDDITQAPDDVTAPEIKIPASSAPDTTQAGTDQPGAQENTQSASGVTGEQSKTSDDKPKTPAEATPPPIPETDHEPSGSSSTNAPSSTPTPAQPDNTPKSGDTNDKGEIYVPGFGWIPNEGGGVEVEEAPNAGTGEKVGDM